MIDVIACDARSRLFESIANKGRRFGYFFEAFFFFEFTGQRSSDLSEVF